MFYPNLYLWQHLLGECQASQSKHEMKYLFQATNAKRKLENIKATNKAKITIKLINNIEEKLFVKI